MSAPGTDELADLYDHEVKSIIEVQEALRQRYSGQMRSYVSFEQEARERLAEIGFTADISWYEFEVAGQRQEGAALPEITITGRVERPAAFDHDQQVHEATHNLLQIPGEEGVIPTDPETLRRFLGEQDGNHSHGGHGHSH
jgi:hypothetical protein